MELLEDIKRICAVLADDNLTKYRIQEELLTMLVKSDKHSLKVKTEAFKQIKEINHKQIEMLGNRW